MNFNKKLYKKKVNRLNTLANISTYGGVALGVATLCVGFVLGGAGLIGCIVGCAALVIGGLTIGVVCQSKADSVSLKDFVEEEVEVSNLEQQKENEPKLVATHQEEKHDDKQNSEEQNLSL